MLGRKNKFVNINREILGKDAILGYLALDSDRDLEGSDFKQDETFHRHKMLECNSPKLGGHPKKLRHYTEFLSIMEV